MDVHTRFLQLPRDVQRIITPFLPLWQRRGLHRPIAFRPVPLNEWTSPHAPYYRTIRRCPRGARWNADWPTHLHVRRQSHVFKWDVRVGYLSLTEDEWTLVMEPQWPDDASADKVMSMMRSVFQQQSWMPHLQPVLAFASLHQVWLNDENHQLSFVLVVERADRTSPPTRQWCAEQMVALVRRLDDVMQREWVMSRKKRPCCPEE